MNDRCKFFETSLCPYGLKPSPGTCRGCKKNTAPGVWAKDVRIWPMKRRTFFGDHVQKILSRLGFGKVKCAGGCRRRKNKLNRAHWRITQWVGEWWVKLF